MSSPKARAAPSLADVEAVFAALGHAARRQIVVILSRLGGELPSGYLAARFQHSWPTTTRHLGVLERAGVVHVRRAGRSSHYRLDRARVVGVLGGWLENLEPPTPRATWTSAGPKTTSALEAKSHPRSPRRGRR